MTKPGIIYGNLLNTTAGFLFASAGDIDFGLLLATLIGTALVIASACVVNNYIDRKLDAKMVRTKNRALAAELISYVNAWLFAAFLGVCGFGVLAFFTNWLTFAIGVTAYCFYIVAYGLAKRKSVHGTLVGTISGALPPVAGYVAVTGSLDWACLIIFLILAFWQMAHFYSIAIYRAKDYKSAGLPVYPIIRGIEATKNQIVIYVICFIAACSALTIFGYAGVIYLIVMVLVGLGWLKMSLDGSNAKDNTAWAKHNFKFSLYVILTLDIMLSVGTILI